MSRPPARPHRVLVIGCGNIAGGFDAARDPPSRPMTHAGAFSRHGGFALAACVEPDAAARAAFMARWAVPSGYASTSEVPPDARFDVIAICSPTVAHVADLRFAIARRPALIFCEKPIAPDLADAGACVDDCAAAGIVLAVNHLRRWAPDVVDIRDGLNAGRWGRIRAVSGTYNKGVLNNGSHLVDLIHYLSGESLELDAAGRAVHDFWDRDPTVPALLHTSSGVPVQLATGDARDFTLFELRVTCERGTMAMLDGGARWVFRDVVPSRRFPGYSELGAPREEPGRIDEAMTRAIAQIHRALETGHPLASTGASAMAAQRLCAAIESAALAPAAPLSRVEA